jgi:hypothetical protein
MLVVTMPIQKKVYFFWFYYTYYAGLLVKKELAVCRVKSFMSLKT